MLPPHYIVGDSAKVIEIDHDAGVVYCETIREITVKPSVDYLLPSTDQVSRWLMVRIPSLVCP